MATVKTSKGHIAVHQCHIADFACGKEEVTAEEIEQLRTTLNLKHPDARIVGPATTEYNCHGFALVSSHGWFCDATRFMNDDYNTGSFSSPQLHDVVIYHHPDIIEPTHTAIVIQIEGNTITRVRSKWAHGFIVEHHPNDVRPYYGRPKRLRRRKTGIPPPGEFVTNPGRDIAEESRQRVIERAINAIADPTVHGELLWASTPEVARLIIASLPAVQELLALGPDAGLTGLRLLEQEPTEGKSQITSIALYLLQLAPVPEAVPSLARGIRAGRFTGMNTVLAADAFLNAAGIQNVTEEPVNLAKREAERFV